MKENGEPLPIVRGNYADPAIIRKGDRYYMTHTSYKYLPGLIVWESRDLRSWRPVSAALRRYVGDVWAPDFAEYDGAYYIYFPANRTNWVITAPSPTGPWSDPVDLKIPGIDPGHVTGPDGRRYLHLSGGGFAELAADGLSVIGEPRRVYEGWPYPEEWVVEAFSLEGPKVTYRDGYYYLTVAEGGTAGPPTSHMAVSARSVHPWGPWEHSPYNPIVRTKSRDEMWWSKGHASLVDTPDGDWRLVYHAYRNGYHTLGRQTLIEPVAFTEDGWFRTVAEDAGAGAGAEAGSEAGAGARAKPNGASGGASETYGEASGSNGEADSPTTRSPDAVNADSADATAMSPKGTATQETDLRGWPDADDFRGETLGLQWQCFGHLPEERYAVRGGALVAIGEGEDDRGSPLLYMPGHESYETMVEATVDGDAEARLVLFYLPDAQLGLGLSSAGVRHFRSFKSYKTMPAKSGRVYLRIRNEEHIVSFSYSSDGEHWERYDKTVDVSGMHHNTFGGFLSLRIGLDVAGKGTATFRRFRYRPIEPNEEGERG